MIIIFLCTFQGERFLEAQLESIMRQSYTYWKIVASDDGSTDETLNILRKYQNILGSDRMEIVHGPQKGFANNFMSLISREVIQEDRYYAYADQDDIWKPDKLLRAFQWIHSLSSEIPALYCSRTVLINQYDQHIGLSTLFSKLPSFPNSLVQSLAGGNTMVFNAKVCLLLQETSKNLNITTHDWWTYMVVSGCGGKIFWDCYPTLYYRQHGANLVGSNSNLLSKLKRIKMLFEGNFKAMNSRNVQNLQTFYKKLTPENQKIFNLFFKARISSFFTRCIAMKKTGIYRQTVLGNLGLVVGTLFNKI